MRTPQITLFALVVALSAPATAAAHKGPSTFERTFRAESRLCAAVAAGNVPTPLQGHEAEVTAACDALHAAYDAAAAAATAGAGGSALKDAVAQVQTACAGDTVDPETCADALRNAYKSLKSDRRGNHGAKKAYRRAIEEARHTFRRAIKSLIAPGWHKHEEPKPDAPSTDATDGDGPKPDAPTDD
jgi:hypothetical protein